MGGTPLAIDGSPHGWPQLFITDEKKPAEAGFLQDHYDILSLHSMQMADHP